MSNFIELLKSLGIEDVQENWNGLDTVWPVLEQMRLEGAVVLINLVGVEGQPSFSLNIIGEAMDGQFIIKESEALERTIVDGISEYAELFWSDGINGKNQVLGNPKFTSPHFQETITAIAKHIGFDPVEAIEGIDWAIPFFEKMRNEKSVALIKLDGERTGEDDNGPYTVVVSGSLLGEESIRGDFHSIMDGMAQVIIQYAKKVWDYEGIENEN